MPRRPRHLSAEERRLWNEVARRADPLAGKRREPPRPPSAAPPPARSRDTQDSPQPLPPFEIGARVDHSRDHDLMAGLSQQLDARTVRMDRKTHGRLRRGKLRPEARLDLHGMTLEEAHPALTGFILSQQARGRRLVLVITGKGRHRDAGGPIPTRLGVLRHQVPQWLRMPPLGAAVLDVTQAHVSHGGEGAYYVYLRRSRQ